MNVVVVTGAATGIGYATAARLTEDGWRVVGVDVDPSTLAAAAGELGMEPVLGDVSQRVTHERAADAAEAAGRLHAWVNNAGIERPGRAHELDDADFARTLAVNLGGTALGCSVATRRMLAARAGGAIVNVSSVQSVAAFPGSFSYQASKGGIDALTRQVAVEYAPAGIRCNAVRPGAIDTPLSERSAAESDDPAQAWNSYADLHPLGRVGKASEVAAVIAFLLGPDASFLTGECVAVDGGATARCYAYPPDPDLTASGG